LVDDFPLAIHSINETTVIFGGADKIGNSSVDGSIDPVTGYVEAVWAEGNAMTRYTLQANAPDVLAAMPYSSSVHLGSDNGDHPFQRWVGR
jgi:hypothetical protein